MNARPGVCSAGWSNWYTYVNEDNEDEYLSAISRTIQFEYGTALELSAVRSPKDVLRFARDYFSWKYNRLSNARAVVKDPIALLSAEWLADRFDMDVVIMVRHPCAFVASIVKAGWKLPLGSFLAQDSLMREKLDPYRTEISDAVEAEDDRLKQAAVTWKILYSAAARYRAAHSDWIFLRHEDISAQPMEEFDRLADRLGIITNEKQRSFIRKSTSGGSDRLGSLRRDSRANVLGWKNRLTANEIDRIQEITRPVAGEFYEETDW